MNNLLIRVDSTYESGMGHFMRSLALAQRWQIVNDEIFFLINNNETLKKRIIDEGMNYIVNSFPSGSKEDAHFLIDIVKQKDISWVIIDGYVFHENYFDRLRDNKLNFLIFDDGGELSHYNSNIVLNQNLHGKPEWYNSKKEEFTKLLIGTDYVLLRNEFLKFINHEKNIKTKANNILITLGGSDVNNYSLDVLKSLNKLNKKNINIILVLGANNNHENTIKNFLANSILNIQILKNVDNMPEIMSWADIAFSSGGSTVWELAFMGVPTIVGSTSNIENISLKGLNEFNLFKTVGNLENLNIDELSSIFNDLIFDYNYRKNMSNDSQKFIDGYGSRRVVEYMMEYDK